jgi:hypothetical protein
MSERLEVVINAKDNLTPALRTAGASADQFGSKLDSAGKKASTGLRQVGTEAKQANTSLGGLKANATAIGGAFGVLAAGAAKAGQSFQNQQRQVKGIQAAYGEAADEILQLAENIQQVTVYSNDAARESALYASSLAQNYGLSVEQIEKLLTASADLATVTGLDLYDAVQRTSGAIRGEGEAAERLGLNLSDSAVAAAAAAAGLEGWSTTMTEAEKAQFRLNLLLEQSAYAQGAAAAAAETTAGKTRQLMNEFQDAGQAVGEFLGPIGEVAAQLAPMAVALPVMGAGLGKITTAAGSASGALLRLGAALAPIAAVAAVGGGIYVLVDSFDKANLSAQEAADAIDDLEASIARMLSTGASAAEVEPFGGSIEALQQIAVTSEEAKNALNEVAAEQSALNDLIASRARPACRAERASRRARGRCRF